MKNLYHHLGRIALVLGVFLFCLFFPAFTIWATPKNLTPRIQNEFNIWMNLLLTIAQGISWGTLGVAAFLMTRALPRKPLLFRYLHALCFMLLFLFILFDSYVTTISPSWMWRYLSYSHVALPLIIAMIIICTIDGFLCGRAMKKTAT